MTAWNDDAESWDEPIPMPIRSTWNDIHDVDGFVARAEHAAAARPEWSRRELIMRNVSKRSPTDPAAAGIPVAPVAVQRDAASDLGAICAERGWHDVVTKPAVPQALERPVSAVVRRLRSSVGQA